MHDAVAAEANPQMLRLGCGQGLGADPGVEILDEPTDLLRGKRPQGLDAARWAEVIIVPGLRALQRLDGRPKVVAAADRSDFCPKRRATAIP